MNNQSATEEGRVRKFAAGKHISCLTALYILGSALITLPVLSDDGATLPVLFSALVFVSLTAVVYLFLNKLLCRVSQSAVIRKNSASRAVMYLVLVAVAFAASDAVFVSLADFSEYAASVFLKNTPVVIISVLLFLPAIFLACAQRNGLYKFALCIFVTVAAGMIFLFFAPMGQYLWQNITSSFPAAWEDGYGTEGDRVAQIIRYALINGAVLTAVVGGVGEEYVPPRSVLPGVLIGCVLLAAATVGVLLLFGEGQAMTYAYPYSRAAEATSPDSLFIRAEGIVYYVIFFTSLIKCAVALSALKKVILRFAAVRKGVS